MKKVLLLVLFILMSMLNIAAETPEKKQLLYVFSKSASLLDQSSAGAKVLQTLTKGQELSQLEIKDAWVRVSVNGKAGWVSKYLVSATKPSLEKTDMESMQINLKKESRKRASAYSTAASARGLSADVATTRDIKSDMQAVKKMEENKVKSQDVQKFIKDGNLKLK